MFIEYQSDLTSLSGYSRAARNHVRALIEAGVQVTGINNKHDITDVVLDDYWQDRIMALFEGPRGAPIKIWHETAEFYNPHPAQYNIAMLTFEADKIPNYDINGNPRFNWVKQLNRMDEIWTFSSYMVDVFHRSGVRDDMPINIFPHPIDVEKYKPGPGMQLYDSRRKPIGDDWYKFMFAGQWSKRKAPYQLLSAFMSEFSAREKVCLIIKTYGPDFSPKSRQIVTEQLNTFKKYMRNKDGLPRIYLQLEPLPDEAMPAFTRSADCFVTAAYAEGFGLPIQESMACGIPCVVPESSSFTDLVDWDRGWLAKTRPVPIIGQMFRWYESWQRWWEADILELMAHMRSAFSNREQLEDLGRNCREFVLRNHTFEKVGHDMKKRLEEISRSL